MIPAASPHANASIATIRNRPWTSRGGWRLCASRSRHDMDPAAAGPVSRRNLANSTRFTASRANAIPNSAP